MSFKRDFTISYVSIKKIIIRILVVGASGETGRLAVDQLLNQGHAVTAIARCLDPLPENLNVNKVKAAVDKLTSAEIAIHLKNCDAIVSCLGTTLTSKVYLASLAC